MFSYLNKSKFLFKNIPINNLNQNLIKRLLNTNMTDRKLLVAVCQHTGKNNKDDNFNVFKDQITNAQKAGCKMMFLPEGFDFIAENREQVFQLAEAIDGPLINKYRHLASSLKVWLFLGGQHERNPNIKDEKKVYNAHIVINDLGEIVKIYRKLHLFNLDVPGTRLLESDFCIGGDRVETPVQTPAGKVGLGICYDMRFPEMAIALAKAGANILTYPSSFTVKTGLAHWETLLKTRAVENQCYVIAAAQTGIHNPKRQSYGHAMIVDPWGQIIAQVGDKIGYAIGEIDLDYLKDVRSRLPIWTDRKPECYGYIIAPTDDQLNIDSQSVYKFGSVNIKSSQVFLRTTYSYAFVNHRPVLPGHVLISSLREVKKFTDLTSDEVSDLFNTVQKVQKIIEKENNANSSTICIQDGVDAGQSIDHVHVHLVPRKQDDFDGEINKVYEELRMHDKKLGPILSDEVMAKQASRLRELLSLNV